MPRDSMDVFSLLPRESRYIILGMLDVNPKRRLNLFTILRNRCIRNIPFCTESSHGKVVNAPGHEHILMTDGNLALLCLEENTVTLGATNADSLENVTHELQVFHPQSRNQASRVTYHKGKHVTVTGKR